MNVTRLELSRQSAVNRAQSACGYGTIYRLGQGGMKPYRTVPWDEEREVDCSGFVMWCLGLSRFQDPYWYDTTKIHNEAVAGSGLFTKVPWEAAMPGDLLVYPDRVQSNGQMRHGHVAIVTQAEQGGPVLIIHASKSNYDRHSDAIRETPPEAFVSQGIVARYTRFVEAA